MGNNSVPKFIFRLSRFLVYRGSVLGRFYCSCKCSPSYGSTTVGSKAEQRLTCVTSSEHRQSFWFAEGEKPCIHQRLLEVYGEATLNQGRIKLFGAPRQ